jgi:hypothetical protein
MKDEWGFKMINTNNHKYDYEKMFNEIDSFITEYKIEEIINPIGVDLGINPFDLFLLKKYIEQNNISHILEFGAGSSSKFIDSLGIKRTSFALQSIFYNIDYINLDIKSQYETIQKYIKENKFDMFLIDTEHTTDMATIINEKFLKPTKYKKALFIHDWFDFNKVTYSEQIYYYNNILKKYKVAYITDLPDEYINKLKIKNNIIDNKTMYHTQVHYVPRCSIILNPK